MKALIQSISYLALCAGLAGRPALAQDAPTAPLAPVPLTVQDTVNAPPLILQPSPAAPADNLLNLAQANVELPQAQPRGGGAFVWNPLDGQFSVNSVGGSARPRTLVIRSGGTDDKAFASVEEDLNVMSRILTKAVKEKTLEEDNVTAMGMTIRTLAVGGQSAVQNIYLDGYGALFLLNVRFPLLAPPKTADEETPKEAADSTWEEARQELYGSKVSSSRRVWVGKREEFDAKKVARLKDALLKALKNATNIRNVKSGEFITVVVAGADSGPRGRLAVQKNGSQYNTFAPRQFDYLIGGPRGDDGESLMTLRVKKSDVDDFDKGNTDFDKFKAKVTIAVY